MNDIETPIKILKDEISDIEYHLGFSIGRASKELSKENIKKFTL